MLSNVSLDQMRTSRGIRALALIPSLSAGGSERNVINLAQSLPDFGVAVVIGLYLRPGGMLPYYSGLNLASDFGSHHLDPFDSNRGPERLRQHDSLHPIRLARLAAKVRPDVVLTGSPASTIQWWCCIKNQLTSPRPWLALDGYHPGHSEDYLGSEGTHQSDNSQSLREAYRHCSAVVCPSAELRDAVCEYFDLPPRHVHHIFNPVDVQRIRLAEVRDSKRNVCRFDLTAVGRLTFQKGFDLLIEAIAKLSDYVNVHLTIVGSGPERQHLHDQATDARIRDQVTFAGYHSQPWQIIANSDAFILSSRWEGFAHVVAEAMAVGTPVISTDCDFGPRELLAGGCGILVRPEDPSAISDGILRAITHPAETRTMIDRASQAVEKYSLPAIAPQFAALVKSVCPQSGTQHARSPL